jgi:hypothetical protein
MAKVTGIIKIYVNGSLYRVKKDSSSMDMGGYENTPVCGHEYYGSTSTFKPGTVECRLVHMSDTDLEEVDNISGANVRFETDTGKTYLMRNADRAETVKLEAGGEVPLKLHGSPIVEE